MNLETLFCPNLECPARGQRNQGNLSVHSRKEKRCYCNVCQTTFATTKGTLFYRLRTDPMKVICVLVLLANGCPVPAIVKAFNLDERTVKSWWQRAGGHCEAVHQHIVGGSQLDLGQVQADEIKAKVQGGYLWLAMAMMVRTRLWLGGVVSPRRDRTLIQRLVNQVKAIALCRPLLLAVDGLPSYVNAFQRAFRTKLPRYHQKGRCHIVSWPNLALVQLIKRRLPAGLEIERRIVLGCATQIEQLRQSSQGMLGVINTAYIERLNATFRSRLAWLSRRSRTLAQQPETLVAGLYVVGCWYNFCEPHDSLRLCLFIGRSIRWVKRTPAIAAGLTNHIWTAEELFTYRVPPPRWVPPKQRGRPSKETQALVERWCTGTR